MSQPAKLRGFLDLKTQTISGKLAFLQFKLLLLSVQHFPKYLERGRTFSALYHVPLTRYDWQPPNFWRNISVKCLLNIAVQVATVNPQILAVDQLLF